MYENIADLHEHLLYHLLRFRQSLLNKKQLAFTFGLRSIEHEKDKRALRRGWWFEGDEKKIVLPFIKNMDASASLGFQLLLLDKSVYLYFKPFDRNDEWSHNVMAVIEKELGLKTSFGSDREVFSELLVDIAPISETNFLVAVGTVIDYLQRITVLAKNIPNTVSFVDEERFIKSIRGIRAYRAFPEAKLVFLKAFRQEIIKTAHRGDPNSLQGDTIEVHLNKACKWVFLSGQNSVGKTTVLKYIAQGLYKGGGFWVEYENNIMHQLDSRYLYAFQLYNEEVLNVVNGGLPADFRVLPLIACYGPSRLNVQATDSLNKEAKNDNPLHHLFVSDGLLKNIETELLFAYGTKEMQKEQQGSSKYEELCKMLTTLIPSLERVEVDWEERCVWYYEKSETGQDYEAVRFEELASGVRSIVAMAGDIYVRLTKGKERLFKEDPVLQALGEEPTKSKGFYRTEELFGIVLIDELDLHLHPKWQYELPSLLSKVFPHVQFIASTHSPIPLLGAPKGAHPVFLKVNRNKEQGITVERLLEMERELPNLMPNAILTSPIFDFQQLFPKQHDAEEPIRTEDNYQDIQDAKARMERLKALAEDFRFPKKEGEDEKD